MIVKLFFLKAIGRVKVVRKTVRQSERLVDLVLIRTTLLGPKRFIRIHFFVGHFGA
jgi:hypothetical protein